MTEVHFFNASRYRSILKIIPAPDVHEIQYLPHRRNLKVAAGGISGF